MASEESIMNCEDDDLEDGEIEDDDDDVVEVPKVEQESTASVKKKEKSPSPSHRKSNESKKTSSGRKDKSNQDEDDFMCSIESKIANVLKEKGVDPPMPNIRKQENLEPELLKSSSSSRNNRKRRKRKERKDQKRESSSAKKRSKLSDDNLYMVGGSPDNSGSESEHTSYSSYDSDDYHRSTYDERRNKRRDKYGSRNERERDRKDRRNRDSEKEVCLRFAEYGHCPDDDCQRLHEVRQPKKMELCKFWLMECCAKKEKCSYMHGDFPCKYYYLGLKCIHKDCKFMHGKPLSDNLKQILLKHLDTAPKEILGDFPRIGRENASKMIAQTHIKLCQEHNVPLPESEKTSSKIPSLLEMKLNPPEDFSKTENRKEPGRTTSRWKDAKPSSNKNNTTAKSVSNEPGDALLTEMRGILTEKQIETMASIGVKTVNHINNLTVSQINEIGLSLATIGEIQATAMNMHNKTSNDNEEQSVNSPTIENNSKDAVMADVDMRVFTAMKNIAVPLKSPDTIMSPNQSDIEVQENKPSTSTVKSVVMMSPPSAIDYSQYLRDSNFNNDDENEDEPSLKIDYASDCETEDKKDSQSEDDQADILTNMPTNVPLLPPSFDTSSFLSSASSILSKVDISSSIQQLMEKAAPSTEKVPIHRDPRVRNSSSTASNDTTAELSSPTYKDASSSRNNSAQQKQEQSRRASIYEIESPDEEIDIKLDKDKDMRVPSFLRDSENGDIDFRFPFAPMTNYIPATEIEASYGTHDFGEYKVKIVDIPKPDYSEIKRSFQKLDTIQDPRIQKICEKSASSSSSSTSNSDPRKRKANDDATTSSSSGAKRLQITTILQNSKHYNELSSSQKMVVNEILSDLSTQLKNFHNDKSPSKIFNTTFITQNPRLSQILIGLGVFVNAEGEFEEIKDLPIASPVVNLPNVHQMPPTILPNILQQPPPNLMMQPPGFLGAAANLRPGLLGIAPPALPPFNFDPTNSYESSLNNQGSSFGNEQNFNNRNHRGSNNSNNFRNNSHHRNNNYRSNNRR